MDLRNRTSSVTKLQTNMLQGYFKMIIDSHYVDTSWKNKVESCVKKGVVGKYKVNYAAANDKIRALGIEKYEIEDMDTTIISTIILYERDVTMHEVKSRIRGVVNSVNEDRKYFAHQNGNETDLELYHRMVVAVNNMFKLASAVDDDVLLHDNARITYRRKYTEQLSDILESIEEDRYELFKEQERIRTIEKDVFALKTTNNFNYVWKRLIEKYLGDWSLDSESRRNYYEFIIKAADAGIQRAYVNVGNFYFDGELGQIDYKKAEEYYVKAGEELGIREKYKLASIYINGKSEEHSVQEGQTILNKIGHENKELIQWKRDDGFVCYEWRKKR